MPRYIDADAFRNRIHYQPKNMSVNEVLELVSTMPTADVVERKKGKWVEEDDAIIHGHCSNCGWLSLWQETDVFGMNYCPNCGAVMGERKEDDLYIWIGVWVVILIMLIISLTEIEIEIAEDRINKMFEYDPCEECHERGDDYYQDKDGDWMMRCYDCPLWESGEDNADGEMK